MEGWFLLSISCLKQFESVIHTSRSRSDIQRKMSRVMFRITLAVTCVVVVLLSLADVTEANYKNAPMNGIMFGKRGPTEYDSRSKTFTALCEIATEACQTWFPVQENK